VRCAKSLLEHIPRCQPKDIVVITPYKAQLKLLKKLFRAVGLSATVITEDSVLLATADSFQGWETAFVIWNAVVTRESGPGFVADKYRVCISITRHTERLIATIDSSCINNSERGKVEHLVSCLIGLRRNAE
jgi:superfamily I DNA and/or RNA helicase